MISLLNRAAIMLASIASLLLLLLVGTIFLPTGTRAQTTDGYAGQSFGAPLAQIARTTPATLQRDSGFHLTPIGGTPVSGATVPSGAAASALPATPLPTATIAYLPTSSTPAETRVPTSTPTPSITSTPSLTASVVPSTPIPSATVPDGEVLSLPTEPQCIPAVAINVVTNQEQYRLTEQASMPTDLTALPEVTGLCDTSADDLIFAWYMHIDYTPRDYSIEFGPAYNMHYRWPAQISEGTDRFRPDFGAVVRGGTLTLTAETHVGSAVFTGQKTVTILGTNPSTGVLQAYFSSQFPNSYFTLWRIAQAESNLRHFNDDGHPKWSGDSHHGVGIMQITYPVPTDDEIWSWKHNADAGSRVLQAAYATARSWPATVARSREFTAAVDAYNVARERDEKPRLTRVTVPELTSGNLLCNLQQREHNAIRLYNGAGGTDNLGLPLHEYKLAFNSTERLLELMVDEETRTASAQWVRVTASERPRGSGVADYVNIILARPAPGACR